MILSCSYYNSYYLLYYNKLVSKELLSVVFLLLYAEDTQSLSTEHAAVTECFIVCSNYIWLLYTKKNLEVVCVLNYSNIANLVDYFQMWNANHSINSVNYISL